MITGSIEKVWAQYDSQQLPISEAGSSPSPIDIPVGKSWELHILTKVYNDSPGLTPWTSGVTVEGTIVKWKNAYHDPGEHNGDAEFAINMGNMPSSNVNSSIKFWGTNAYTTTKPA